MDTQEPYQALRLDPHDTNLPQLDSAKVMLLLSIKAMIPSPYAEYAMDCILAVGFSGVNNYTVMLCRQPKPTFMFSGVRAPFDIPENRLVFRRVVIERVSGSMQKDDADHVTLWSQRDGLREVNLPEDWWS